MFNLEQFSDACTNQAAACCWAAGRIDVFWRGRGDRLQHRWYERDSWGTETLPDTVTGNPTACSWGPNRIDLFWREPSGALHHKWYDGRWGAETLDAQLNSAPAACSWGPNRIDLFWREPSGALHHRWYDGRWGDETLSSSQLHDAPAACSGGLGRIDLFWRSASGSLVHRYFDRGGWSSEQDLGGMFQDVPTACSWVPGVVDAFVRASDNSIWHRWYDEGWHSWVAREGQTPVAPGVTTWGDGRIDIFMAGLGGQLWHGSYHGQPVATRGPQVKTLWGFLRDYTRPDKIERLHNSFAAGLLNGGCSGAMASPHIFLTASHCGGPGWTGGVQFYRIDPFALPPDHRSQQITAPYAARTFPWQDSGLGGDARLHGDTVLWWLEDGEDGVPPGIKYGYQEISELDVEIGTIAYSFWSNPAIRLDKTLLYSSGAADSRQIEDTGVFGRYTHYLMWTAPGASGSTNLVADGDHRNRVVGVTQGGGGLSRSVPDAAKFLSEYDADHNRVIDAIDYDWLMTAPIQRFYLFFFDSPFRLSRWVAVPNGSGTSPGDPIESLGGFPAMTGTAATATQPAKTDGYWNHFARFQANHTYRLSVAARGNQDGSAPAQFSYVKFRSDRSGHEVRFDFRPQATADRFTGRITLGAHSDYRLILGTDPGTSVVIESLAITLEGPPLEFASHDERRSWEYINDSQPTSWGTRGADSFGGAVVGPTTAGWGLRNRFLGLLRNTRYRIRFEVRPIRGVARIRACYARLQDLGGAISGELRWDFTPAAAPASQEFVAATGDGAAKTLVFGIDHDAIYLVGAVVIEPV
jgi:hypothetical protein